MWSHYLIKSGYTKQALANIDKGFGILATILGIQIGVQWINRYNIASGFRLWAVLQGAMACLFMAHAYYGRNSEILFFASVSLNHLVGGIGNVTLVTYMSNLCKTKDQKDSLNYAMLTSIGSMGRMVVSYGACLVAASVSWPIFFLIAGLVCTPALLLACTRRPFQKRLVEPSESKIT
jgi:PAT family beta-lactamase induction signal transducer AmpG